MSSTLSSLDNKNGIVSAEVVGTVVVVGLVVVPVGVSEYLFFI